MEKEGGNREIMRKCKESISLHFLILSPFSRSQDAKMAGRQDAAICATL